MEVQTYVEFLYPGIVFDESSAKPVDGRNPSEIEVPDRAHAFRFYDVGETTDEDSGVTLKSERMHYSGTYYPGGEVWTQERVWRELPDERILLSNMKGNRWEEVVRTRFGSWHPVRGKVVMLPDPAKAPA